MRELGERHHHGIQGFVTRDFGVGAGFEPHNNIFYDCLSCDYRLNSYEVFKIPFIINIYFSYNK